MECEEDSNLLPDTGNGHVYFLSETRKFRSVVELVTFYSRNSLKESFKGLDTPLRFPVGEVTLVIITSELGRLTLYSRASIFASHQTAAGSILGVTENC